MQTPEEILKDPTIIWVAKNGKIQPINPYKKHCNSIGYCRMCEFDKIIKNNIHTCPSIADGEYSSEALELQLETDEFFRKTIRLKTPSLSLSEQITQLQSDNQTLLDEVNRLNAYITNLEKCYNDK